MANNVGNVNDDNDLCGDGEWYYGAAVLILCMRVGANVHEINGGRGCYNVKNVNNYAGGCNYVFAFETRGSAGLDYCCVENDVLWHACLQIGAGKIEPGTSAKFASQTIGQTE